MSTETIKAIGDLWLLASILLLTLCVFLFRKQIIAFLERLTYFQYKDRDKEVLLKGEPAQEKSLVEQNVRQDILTRQIEEKSSTTSEGTKLVIAPNETESKQPNTAEEWLNKMVVAFIERDEDASEEAFKKAQELEGNSVKKLRYQALRFGFRYKWLRDVSALDKLKNLAIQPEIAPTANYWIGRCYDESGDFERAASFYILSAQGREDENEKAENIGFASQSLFNAGKQEEAFHFITREFNQLSSLGAKTILYKSLASLYDSTEESELKALALEKAIEESPNDSGLRFDAAFAYGEKLDLLTLLHYKTLLDFEPNNSGGLNNIAIQYGRLTMPISAAKFYKRASEQNNTLSHANLAYIYMNAGFADEAREILDKAKQFKNIHPNVGSAIASLSKKEDDEQKSEEKYLKIAREQQKLLRQFAEAYFVETTQSPSFVGAWQFTNNDTITISQNGTEVEANWISNEIKYMFKGKVSNRATKVSFHKMNYGYGKTETGFTKDGQGYVYLSSDGKQLHLMKMKSDGREHSIETLNKIDEVEQKK